MVGPSVAMAGWLGGGAVAGCVGGGYMLYLKIFTNIPVPGLTAILLTIVLFGGCKYF